MKNNAPLVNFRRLSIPLPWWLVMWIVIPYLLWKTARALARLVPVAGRNWRSLTLTAGGLWLWHQHGWLVLVLVLVAVAGLGGLWWWRWRGSCERFVVLPLLAWWRRLFVYTWHWREALTVCRLAERFDGRLTVPKLLGVRCTFATDEVLLRMPRGQNPDLYHKAAANLAYSFNSRTCRVYPGRRTHPPVRSGRWAPLLRAVDRVRYRDRPRLVWLVFIRRDPLQRTVPAFPVPEEPDFTALPLALREDLETFLLRLLATHLLIVGATRSGKGSVQWSLIRALASGIRSGLVRLWGIDPKGGVELSIGRELFSRYEYADPAPMVDMLEELVGIMRARQARMQGKVRVHAPTLDEPLYVLMVDEMLALVALLLDIELRNRARAALALLLTQGAGLGILVVGSTQDPRKEVVELRDFFPTRVAMRLNEPNQVDLVLGDGARNRGALCDQIPAHPSMRGVGYVVLDDRPEPARVRFSYVTDDEIRAMAQTYAASATPAVEKVPEPRKEPRRHTYRPGRHAAGPLLPDSLATLLDGGESA
ncbi:FtsK/SpoIIIE domain-containing protein [Dactylosporangium fulvum]|uniref:FtsK/SpoIIIE domain-containing protein n=1 Tax=Dactylosporangium fulvum TaxID=53359 RepID=A0ABY5W223_9ACTN|nr:FtsK/SpoIIIE domain-containing protein [Dactylosporangium fulvum]UWP82768.1 FtsK/SpoIIIE domain-containing protein [Dactylosporangium fulvum]